MIQYWCWKRQAIAPVVSVDTVRHTVHRLPQKGEEAVYFSFIPNDLFSRKMLTMWWWRGPSTARSWQISHYRPSQVGTWLCRSDLPSFLVGFLLIYHQANPSVSIRDVKVDRKKKQTKVVHYSMASGKPLACIPTEEGAAESLTKREEQWLPLLIGAVEVLLQGLAQSGLAFWSGQSGACLLKEAGQTWFPV